MGDLVVSRRQFLLVGASAAVGTMITNPAEVAPLGAEWSDLHVELFSWSGNSTLLSLPCRAEPIMIPINRVPSRYLDNPGKMIGDGKAFLPEVPGVRFKSQDHIPREPIPASCWEVRFRNNIICCGLVVGTRIDFGNYSVLGLPAGEPFRFDKVLTQQEVNRTSTIVLRGDEEPGTVLSLI